MADKDRITPFDVQKPQRWVIGVGYRYQPSSRPFIGTVEQSPPSGANAARLQNVFHLWDISVERQLTRRFSATASLPIQLARRDQPYVPSGTFRVNSIGDMTVGGRAWLFRPPTEGGGNVAVGMSLKLPTGKYNATGVGSDARGQAIATAVDQSIQAGDGTVGFAVEAQAYHPLWFRSMAYFSGSYLVTPADTNGVSSGRRRFRETVNSVPDQYLARGGISHSVPGVAGLVATLGGRWEGVPVRDLIGKSNGFRRPGYAISVDPGLLYARWGYIFSCNVPWAIERNLRRSVPEIANGFRNGDAASFADYLVILGLSRRF
ncbi:MAG: hypothetical protein ABI693_33970 [Bryobacteraceae bacterium]